MATPIKPGPHQQRATDNFLLQQVKWVDLSERVKVVQLQARQHLLSEAFRFGLAIGVSLQGGRKFSARRENFPSVLLPFVPASYPYFSVTRSLRSHYPVVARAPAATGSVHSASNHLQHGGIIAMPVSDPAQPKASSSQVVPVLCLLGVVVLLSSITPMMKYVFQHSSLTFLSIASGRIILRPAVAAPSLTSNPFRPSKGGYN
jgi:hypothetical protein